MIGSQGMRDEMDELDIDYFGHGPEPQDNSDGSAFMYDIELKEKVSEFFNYRSFFVVVMVANN